MNMEDIERRFAEIDAQAPEEPTEEDLKAIQLAAAEAPEDAVPLDDFREYSGKMSLRIPRSLHKELVERARLEGVSVNAYITYKLSHS